MLLPRTGPLSAFADEQLSAASVTVGLTEADVDTVVWRDAGSTPRSAAAGARALVDAGATVVVGPIGASNVRAAMDAVGDDVSLVVPGESVAGARGVAPSLESRLEGLIAAARRRGARQIMVLAPANGYGRRALRAIRASVRDDALVVQTYPVDTTSFQPLITPLLGGLGPGGAVIVPDHVSRLESVIRQLIRLGKVPSASGDDGVMVLSTAEGLSAQVLVDTRKILAGVWMAPTAWASDQTADFEQAYLDAEGRPPGDQALLVHRALQDALGLGATPRVTLVHVTEDGMVHTDPEGSTEP